MRLGRGTGSHRRGDRPTANGSTTSAPQQTPPDTASVPVEGIVVEESPYNDTPFGYAQPPSTGSIEIDITVISTGVPADFARQFVLNLLMATNPGLAAVLANPEALRYAQNFATPEEYLAYLRSSGMI